MRGFYYIYSDKDPQRGAAMVELAIVIPLLLLLIIGVANIGQALTQMTWIINTTYTTAIAGATASKANRPSAMQTRGGSFVQLNDPIERPNVPVREVLPAERTVSGRDIVEVQMQGEVKYGFGVHLLGIDRFVSQKIVAPILVLDSGSFAADILKWGNEADYDCSGVRGGIPLTSGTCVGATGSDF